MKQASICTIGYDILIGQVVDTNSSHISQALNSLGIKVSRMVSIGDDHDTIVSSLENELRSNDIVIVTGGLGPTKDDITKKALAELSGATSYRTDDRQLEIVIIIAFLLIIKDSFAKILSQMSLFLYIFVLLLKYATFWHYSNSVW